MYAYCSTTRLGGTNPNRPADGAGPSPEGWLAPQTRPPNSPSKTTSPAEITRLSA